MFSDTVNKPITRSTSVFQVLQIYRKSYTEYWMLSVVWTNTLLVPRTSG